MSRITSVRPILIRIPLPEPLRGPFGTLEARPNLIVRVETSAGHAGIGEVWANFPPWGCGERVEIVRQVLAPMLVGETLDDPARFYRAMHARLRLLANQWGAPGPAHQAIAGVDIALWDAHARIAGKPLADLLRGAPAPRSVAAYGSGIGPHVTARLVERGKAMGHTRFKVRVAFGAEADRATLAAAREAAGEAPLMADANQTLTPESFAILLPALAAARLEWMEEPFPVDDVAAYANWPRHVGIPLAFGENARGLAEIEDVIALGADIVQPDITKTGGITEGLEMGRRVVMAGRKLCYHMFGGALGLYASAHLSAAIDGAHWLETDVNPNPLFDEVLTDPPRIRQGRLLLPPGPGLGVDLAEGVEAKWSG